MSILRQAIRDEIYDMNHEPNKAYEGQWFFKYPQVNWQNVYYRMLNLVDQHIDTDTVPEDIVTGTLDEFINQAKDEQWVEDMLIEAREATQEHMEEAKDPYGYRGVNKSQFLSH